MGIMNTMMPIEISEFAKMVNEKNAHSFLFFKKKIQIYFMLFALSRVT